MQVVWLILGLISLAIGAIGAFVPLLPTVPLVILAAFFFSKSSENLHNWLLTHDVFGPFIENWRQNRSISRSAKIYSTISIAAVFILSLLLGLNTIVIIIQAIVLGSVSAFIWTRPTG